MKSETYEKVCQTDALPELEAKKEEEEQDKSGLCPHPPVTACARAGWWGWGGAGRKRQRHRGVSFSLSLPPPLSLCSCVRACVRAGSPPPPPCVQRWKSGHGGGREWGERGGGHLCVCHDGGPSSCPSSPASLSVRWGELAHLRALVLLDGSSGRRPAAVLCTPPPSNGGRVGRHWAARLCIHAVPPRIFPGATVPAVGMWPDARSALHAVPQPLNPHSPRR